VWLIDFSHFNAEQGGTIEIWPKDEGGMKRWTQVYEEPGVDIWSAYLTAGSTAQIAL
jgi:hypothetical protein